MGLKFLNGKNHKHNVMGCIQLILITKKFQVIQMEVMVLLKFGIVLLMNVNSGSEEKTKFLEDLLCTI